MVPDRIPVTVALGELNEWLGLAALEVTRGTWTGLAYCKLGLSHAPRDWIDRWRALRQRLADSEASFPAWVAVVYIDWQAAQAPKPEAVIEAANAIDECHGVLFDTWNKAQRPEISLTWERMFDRVRDCGRFVALAGSLDVGSISRLGRFGADIFGVRGSACAGGNRLGPVDAERVSLLACAARHAKNSRPTCLISAGQRQSYWDVPEAILAERKIG